MRNTKVQRFGNAGLLRGPTFGSQRFLNCANVCSLAPAASHCSAICLALAPERIGSCSPSPGSGQQSCRTGRSAPRRNVALVRSFVTYVIQPAVTHALPVRSPIPPSGVPFPPILPSLLCHRRKDDGEAEDEPGQSDKFGDVVTIWPHVPLQTIPRQIVRSQLSERLSIEEAGVRCSRRPRRNKRR
jgi:hypothetical protein